MKSGKVVRVPGLLLSVLFSFLVLSDAAPAETQPPPLSTEDQARFGEAIQLVRNGRQGAGLRLASQGTNPLAA